MARDNTAHKARGFTLIELMIVVAIIGIIAAIAYPSYTEYVQKSRRADGMAALQSFAGAMERHFTVNSTYCGAGTDDAGSPCGSNSDGSPTIFSVKSPLDGPETYYSLEITSVSTTSFTLSAIRAGVQVDDRCGALTLTHTGERDAVLSGTSVDDCWP